MRGGLTGSATATNPGLKSVKHSRGIQSWTSLIRFCSRPLQLLRSLASGGLLLQGPGCMHLKYHRVGARGIVRCRSFWRQCDVCGGSAPLITQVLALVAAGRSGQGRCRSLLRDRGGTRLVFLRLPVKVDAPMLESPHAVGVAHHIIIIVTISGARPVGEVQ